MIPSLKCISPGCGYDVGAKATEGLHHPRSCGRTICDAYAEGFEAGQVAEAKWHAAHSIEAEPAFAVGPVIETIVEIPGLRTKVAESRLQTAVNALVSIHQRAFGIETPEVEMPMGNRLQRIAAIVETTLTGFSMREKIE